MPARFALVVLFLSSTSVAHAHDEVDDAIRLTGLAQFDEALAAFERAEAADDLTREELVVLYENRAVLHAAMGSAGAMDVDLAALAALEPGREMPPSAPPEVAERFSALAAETEPLDLLAVPRWDVGGVAVRAVTTGGPAGLVRSTRVGARLLGRGYKFGEGRVLIPTAAGSAVEYFAEAIGPGGAVLATVGSLEAPLRGTPPAPIVPRTPEEPDPPAVIHDSSGLSVGTWLLIGGGILVVVGVAILIAVLASAQGNPDTLLGEPTAEPP